MRKTYLLGFLVVAASCFMVSCSLFRKKIIQSGDDAPVVIADTSTLPNVGNQSEKATLEHMTTLSGTYVFKDGHHVYEKDHRPASVTVCTADPSGKFAPVMLVDLTGFKTLEVGQLAMFTLRPKAADPADIDIAVPLGSISSDHAYQSDIHVTTVKATMDSGTTTYERSGDDPLRVLLHYCKGKDCHSQALDQPCGQ
jgi:hypothetical protein